MNNFSRSIGTALAALLTACASAPTRPLASSKDDQAGIWAHLTQLIQDGLQRNKVVGLSIAVVDDQNLVWSYGAGWADAEHHVPATDHTLYRMGSISKLFTTTAALQLAQQGRLDLDASIQTLLPDFRVRAPQGQSAITPRLLMTHHAGLTRDVGKGMWGQRVDRFQDLVMGLQPDAQSYPAGLMFSYSNVGLTVLGAAVEKVAGEPFEIHLQHTLLDSLGMRTASFSQSSNLGATVAYKDGKIASEPALRDVPAGGLNASVLDMTRFLSMVFGNGLTQEGKRLLDASQLSDMLRPQNPGKPLDMDMRTGLGWMLNSTGVDELQGGGPVAHHGGGTPHFHSAMYALPEHKLGVIVAANSAEAGELVDSVARRALSMVLESKTGIRQPPTPPDFAPLEAPWTEAQLQVWEGDYATVVGHVRVVRQGRALLVHSGGNTLNLLPGLDNSAGLRYKLLGLVTLPIKDFSQSIFFRRQLQGRELLVVRLRGQEFLVGERLPPQDNAMAIRWLGSYRPVDQPVKEQPVEHITLYLDGQRLLARVNMAAIEGGAEAILPVRMVSAQEARALGPLADFGESVSLREANGRSRLTVSGLAFEREQP